MINWLRFHPMERKIWDEALMIRLSNYLNDQAHQFNSQELPGLFTVGAFMPLADEPRITTLFDQAHPRSAPIQWSVPRTDPETGGMTFRVVSPDTPWETSVFGTQEPPAHSPMIEQPHVILVPGLAFSRKGIRLGRGAGFYDRYFADHLASRKIGIAYDGQLFENLPSDPHDQPMHAVLTSSFWIECEEQK